eukprot:TRINITY_DN709_c0_g2_i2.p1 TRINITY_DN709_c0_g2~~TRINITY_DN709_c0_g2_i2.p1  ORF type:complete len:1106 (+),score=377.01 TRINITY_DN709_c0_g2_i2:337-3318(+)
MHAPPLEMFHFSRKVIDEYTYLSGQVLSMASKLTADRHWVLSGTPPIHDFAALKTISAFLDLHLGIDDALEMKNVSDSKKRFKELTSVEKFHSFREVHTPEWHSHRNDLGQKFLDQFVRQNVAEIDEIPFTIHVEKIDLPAAERAIYLELEHHLKALDMVIKKGKKSESDREKRMHQVLGDSDTAEEALLKRCSHFEIESVGKDEEDEEEEEEEDSKKKKSKKKSEAIDINAIKKKSARKTCDVIVEERTNQLNLCKEELLKRFKEAAKQEKEIGDTGRESLFQEYTRVTRSEGQGDKEATLILRKLLDEAKVKPAPTFSSKKQQDDLPKEIKDKVWAHREFTHEIRRITKELVGRVRSLRYFTAVRDLQKHSDSSKVRCPSCKKNQVPIDEVALLSSCGHTGCYDCVRSKALKEECVHAKESECGAAARVTNIVKGSILGVDEEEGSGGKHFGTKIEKIIQLIKSTQKQQDRVLIFVQFPDLLKKVAEALDFHGIKYAEISGQASSKAKNLAKYQSNHGDELVLLLNVMDESSSGSNLTNANHAIFVSPLLAPSQEIYDARETQAIGRIRRYGQNKHVHIHKFLSVSTIDEEIFEQRTSKTAEPELDEEGDGSGSPPSVEYLPTATKVTPSLSDVVKPKKSFAPLPEDPEEKAKKEEAAKKALQERERKQEEQRKLQEKQREEEKIEQEKKKAEKKKKEEAKQQFVSPNKSMEPVKITSPPPPPSNSIILPPKPTRSSSKPKVEEPKRRKQEPVEVATSPSEEEEFELDEVLDSRWNGNRFEYYISYSGYGPEENCWVDYSEIDPDNRQEFHELHPTAPKLADKSKKEIENWVDEEEEEEAQMEVEAISIRDTNNKRKTPEDNFISSPPSKKNKGTEWLNKYLKNLIRKDTKNEMKWKEIIKKVENGVVVKREDVLDSLSCSICNFTPTRPFTSDCGRNYCRNCIYLISRQTDGNFKCGCGCKKMIAVSGLPDTIPENQFLSDILHSLETNE